MRYEEVTYLEVLLCRKTSEQKKRRPKNENFEIMNDYNDIVNAIFHNDKEYSDTSSMD